MRRKLSAGDSATQQYEAAVAEASVEDHEAQASALPLMKDADYEHSDYESDYEFSDRDIGCSDSDSDVEAGHVSDLSDEFSSD